MMIDEAIAHCLEVAEQNETQADKIGRQFIGSAMDKRATDCRECAADHRQLAEWLTELKEAKRLLKAAVEDFAKLDRVNTKVRNCMMPDMDCADCPLSWDSVDDSVEPCHNWRYTNEALALIGEDTNVGGKIDSWISCKDKMPEDNTSVLFVYVSENGVKSAHYGYHTTIRGVYSGWSKTSGGWEYSDEEVTHWQPIPEPPKE